tara:strand:+ start:33 stop:386 length:354 start_codon:yes stop_codon:yes gene_type:complete
VFSFKTFLYLPPQNKVGMRKGIHPEEYRMVIFKDMSNGHAFICRSCANTQETMKWEDGNEYPLIKLEISSKSHPFYTGKLQLIDTAGRVDKFRNRYKRHIKEGEVTEGLESTEGSAE